MKEQKGELVIAVPSKGRLQSAAEEYLAAASLAIERSGATREYTARMQNIPSVSVVFLSAGEIAASLAQGSIHLGITGEDLLRETVPDITDSIHMLVPMNFGFADVVVAVPRAWFDVSTMADLDDVALVFHSRHRRRLRVATKYANLTYNFFARHDLGEYRIVESLGATEGAPAVGAAEVIVDITSTGATLAANKLKVLDDGVILKSQAWLSASLKAHWTAKSCAALKEVAGGFMGSALGISSSRFTELLMRLSAHAGH
jgi:ATP phosphoribosyltransferase